ncbi:MAG: DUF2726 domain-containing protein [bacterium]|nr:DUF2726 domain-containing protein [bacterium]
MKLLLVFVVFAALAFMALAVRGGKKTKKVAAEQPKARLPLTKNEQPMYFRLVEALPGHVVLAQVAFSALLTARAAAARNRFDRKVADFVVCTGAFEVVAVIELDDKSHKGKEAADAARDEILQGAGYRVLRYSRTPNTEQLRKDLGLELPVPGRQE